MRRLVGALVILLGCGGEPSTDLPNTPPTPPTYTVALDLDPVPANGLIPRTVTVSGGAGDIVTLKLDRSDAGSLASATITLDAQGEGTTAFYPCDYWMPGCTGTATISLELTSDPSDGVLASTLVTLVKSETVGEVAPCQTSDNTFYIHGADSLFTGTHTSAPGDAWIVNVTPDQISFDVEVPGAWPPEKYTGRFSLLELATPLAPGVFEMTARSPTAGHAGMEVLALAHGCNEMTGRFQIHEYDADPMTGAVQSVTISFEQFCDGAQQLSQGCFHYQATPPAAAPVPDPTKVSVQVFTSAGTRTPDPTATAIFFDDSDNVVLDTTVSSFGQAEASLPSGGSLIVIQDYDSIAHVRMYRGLVNGNHVELNPGSTTKTLMLASFTQPADPIVEMAVSCGADHGAAQTDIDARYLEFSEQCRASTFDLMTFAKTISNVRTQFVWQTGLPYVANGNVTAGTNWLPMGTNHVTLTNVPAGLSSYYLRSSVLVGTSPYELDSATETSPAAGTHSYTMEYPAGGGSGPYVMVQNGGIDLVNGWWRVASGTSASDDVTIDFATLPVATPSVVQQSQTGLSWTQVGSTGTVRDWLWLGVLSSGQRVQWMVTEPFDGQASATIPALPAGHAAIDATLDSGITLKGAGVTLTAYTSGGGVMGPPSGAYQANTAGSSTYNPHF